MDSTPRTGPPDDENPLQGYYDWQVTTLMLARDLGDPLPGGDEAAWIARREETESMVREMTLAVLPEAYRNDPNRDWPPELFMDITRVTLMRAANLAGIAEG